MAKLKLPRRLRLRPGLHRRGYLTVLSESPPVADPAEHRWVVDWDAQIVERVGMPEGYVMDRCVMASKQILDWTGVDVSLPPPDEAQ